MRDDLTSFPIARPIVKRPDRIPIDQQGVHKIIGKIVEPHAPAPTIDFGAPGVIVVARRSDQASSFELRKASYSSMSSIESARYWQVD